jgi:hypothetical protein
MKTFISKKGYYYKEYKSGKRKRIPKKEYIKLNLKGGSDPSLTTWGFNQGLQPNRGAPNRLLVTEFIETKLHVNIRTILVKSEFYNVCMKPLLDLKQVKIKNPGPKGTTNFITKTSTIREPIFTIKPGQNFQDRLFEWWKEVSSNFENTAQDYVLMKKVDLELINETGEHSSDYFYLQLPVVFINRILQMLEYYNEMLFSHDISNNTDRNVILFKSKREINNNTGLNLTKTALDTFRNVLSQLDIFWNSDGLYLNLFNVEKAILEWYAENVTIYKNINRELMNRIIGRSYNLPQESNTYIKNLSTYFTKSYDRKYCIMPTSMDPSEEYMLNMYTIPVVIYLSKLIPVHKGKANNVAGLFAHPLLQLQHDFTHMQQNIYEYYELSKCDGIQFHNYMKFRKEFFKNILTQDKILIDLVFSIFHELNSPFIAALVSMVKFVNSEDRMIFISNFQKLYIRDNEYKELCQKNNIPVLKMNSLNPFVLYSIFKNLADREVAFTIQIEENEYPKSLLNTVTTFIEHSFKTVYGTEIEVIKIYDETEDNAKNNAKNKIYLRRSNVSDKGQLDKVLIEDTRKNSQKYNPKMAFSLKIFDPSPSL